MNRRKLLGTVGLGATGMAGLLGGGASGARQDTETTTTAAATTTATGGTTTADDRFTGIDSSADRPFARVSLGSRAGVENPENNLPHRVRVWNDSEQARTIGVTVIERRDAGSPVLDRTFEFPADGYLTLRLLEPGDYRVRVREGGRVLGEIRVPRAWFDCNDSRTDVAVTTEGQVKSITVTTEIGCPPEVVERTFTQLRGNCGSANDASVEFASGTVTVHGSIRAPNPCYGATLADVAVTDADALRVTVATTEPTADVCVQCVGTIEYRAHLGFRDRVPGTVRVVHERGGESETVATVTRDASETTSGETTATEATTTGASTETTTTGASTETTTTAATTETTTDTSS